MAESNIQGFKNAHARLLAAKDSGRVPPRPEFHYWEGVDFQDAFMCVAKHGASRCRVESREGLGKDGAVWEHWLVVVDNESGEILGAFDVSHPCPPDCPTTKKAEA